MPKISTRARLSRIHFDHNTASMQTSQPAAVIGMAKVKGSSSSALLSAY